MPRATAWADQCDLFADLDAEPETAAEPTAAEAAEALRARRAERLARETAELAERAERAAAQLAERRARPDVAEWRARFERVAYIVGETRDGLPIWSSAFGWQCPSCGKVERTEDALRREHGYNPDQPGAVPPLAAEFGDLGACHRARLIASQAAAKAANNATCEPGKEWTHDTEDRGAAEPVTEAERDPKWALNLRARAAEFAARRRVAEDRHELAGDSVEPVAEAEPTADDDGRAWLEARYAGWVARQERRAAADTAAHAEPEPDDDDDDDQADEPEPVAELPAINPAWKHAAHMRPEDVLDVLRAPCEGITRPCELGWHGQCTHKRGGRWADGQPVDDGSLMYGLTAGGKPLPGQTTPNKGIVLDPETGRGIAINPGAHLWRCECDCHATARAKATLEAESVLF